MVFFNEGVIDEFVLVIRYGDKDEFTLDFSLQLEEMNDPE